MHATRMLMLRVPRHEPFREAGYHTFTLHGKRIPSAQTWFADHIQQFPQIQWKFPESHPYQILVPSRDAGEFRSIAETLISQKLQDLRKQGVSRRHREVVVERIECIGDMPEYPDTDYDG